MVFPAKKTATPAAKKAAAPAAGKTAPAKKVSSAKKAPIKKAQPIIFKAPEDFKPAFFEINFNSLRDGLIHGGSVVVNRIKGKWDNPDAPRFNLAEYDLSTLLGITARLGAMAMAPNIMKRLPPKSKFGVILRVNRRAVDGSIAIIVKGAKTQVVSAKTGKPKWVWVNAQSEGEMLLLHRRMRKMGRFLTGAFVEVQLPPSKRRVKKGEEEATEE